MSHRLARLALRLLIAGTVAVVIALAPLPLWSPQWVIHVHVPLVVFVLVCYAGKLILDTFFYPRYP